MEVIKIENKNRVLIPIARHPELDSGSSNHGACNYHGRFRIKSGMTKVKSYKYDIVT